jgi:hypothetical protein
LLGRMFFEVRVSLSPEGADKSVRAVGIDLPLK